jgi:hypothetical protein
MALVGALLFCATAQCADWGFDANAGLEHSDNESNAVEAADRKSDGAATLGLSGLLHLQPSENTSLALNLVAESASHFRFSGLDNPGIGTRAQLRQWRRPDGGQSIRRTLGPERERELRPVRGRHRYAVDQLEPRGRTP